LYILIDHNILIFDFFISSLNYVFDSKYLNKKSFFLLLQYNLIKEIMQQVKFTLRTNVGITISLKISLLSRIRTVFGFLS